MKVLITGAKGFIGRHLTEACHNNPEFTEILTTGRDSVPVQCTVRKRHTVIDLTVQWEVERMFARFKPDIIFHLAANPLTKPDEKNPTQIIRDNIAATQNLLHFCPQGCKFIYASSIIVYGDWLMKYQDVANKTVGYIESDQCVPTSVYGMTKVAGENLVRIYTEFGKVNGISARMSATVGAGQTHGILPDLIKKAQSDSPMLDVIGCRPGSSKPYVYIDDTIQALMLMAKLDGYNVFNVSSVDAIDCEVIGNAVLKYFYKPCINWLGASANWKGDNPKLLINPNSLLAHGWKPEFRTAAVAVEQAVTDYYDELHRVG